jgi:hypothetical protein
LLGFLGFAESIESIESVGFLFFNLQFEIGFLPNHPISLTPYLLIPLLRVTLSPHLPISSSPFLLSSFPSFPFS